MKIRLLVGLVAVCYYLPAQVPVSQIEGYFEVYHPQDCTSVYVGIDAGRLVSSLSGRENTLIGHQSGASLVSGLRNSFYGFRAGGASTDGSANSFFGVNSGTSNTLGNENSFFGVNAGGFNNQGSSNCYFGVNTGAQNTTGSNNAYFGRDAGFSNQSGQANTFLGTLAGRYITGSFNICLGVSSGPIMGQGGVSERLYIDVESTSNPLIYGEFDNDLVQINGKLKAGKVGHQNHLLVLNSERPWVFKQEGSGSGTALKLTTESEANNNKNFIIDIKPSGGVVIGPDENLPQEMLHVVGNAYKTSGGGSWATPSDRRLKKDISPYSKGLEAVRKIEPVSFFYNGELNTGEDVRQIGVIAQELQAICPEMVSEISASGDAKFLKVDPGTFDFLLINAVKELAGQNDFLMQRIADQQLELEELKLQLARHIAARLPTKYTPDY